MKKRVILISLDALSCTDFSYVQNLPNFKKIIEKGAFCKNELSVYPSLTFPCHASIATGCVPQSHGIISNYLFEPKRDIPHWNFYASNLKKKAIWDYANENQKKVLNMSWPVSSGAKIEWSMPEMTPVKPKIWNTANFFRQLHVFFKYGTASFAIKSLIQEPSLIKYWLTGKQPSLDRSIIKQFERCVKQYPYDIALLHVYGMDNAKHNFGVQSKEAISYLELYDKFIGNLIDYADSRTAYGENVCIMITGDHSQLPVNKAIYLNMLLAELGLCKYKNGVLEEWTAIFAPCDGSSYLYVRDKKMSESIAKTVTESLKNNPAIDKIFNSSQARSLGADENCVIMVEASDGYGTETGWNKNCSKENNFIGESHCIGLHGYLPTHKDYQTMFFAYGSDIVSGFEIPEMCITDITPTICSLMNMRTDNTDGKPLEQIFKK